MLREQYDTQRSAAGPKEKSPVRSATDSVEAAGRRSAVLSAEAARRGVKGGIAELKEKNAAQRQQAANADTNNSGFQDAAPSPQERLRRETAAKQRSEAGATAHAESKPCSSAGPLACSAPELAWKPAAQASPETIRELGRRKAVRDAGQARVRARSLAEKETAAANRAQEAAGSCAPAAAGVRQKTVPTPKTGNALTPNASGVRRMATPVAAAANKAKLDAEKKLQRQMVHQAAVKAKKAAQETSRSAAHVAKAAARAIVAAAKSLASAGGIVALLVVVLLVGLIAATAASPFGIFFSGEHTPPDAVPVSAAVAEVNGDFNARLEALQEGGAYDNVVVDGAPADWPEVLAVFASKVAGADGSEAADVVTIDRDRVEKLKAVFWDMTVIDSYVEVIEHGDSDPNDDVDDSSTERILHIVITAKMASEMPALYGFTARQTSAMNELLAQRAMLTELAGSLSISSAEAGAVLEKLPDGIAPDRKAVIQAACSLVGKVNYFWGGKSLVIGWDSRWGRVEKVTAAGSRSTGTCRPYGLDCSGFVDWVFYNATDGKYVIGHGGGAQAQHACCTAIAWSDAQPGDLVFYPHDTHVGIVAGRDGSGNLQIIHCSSGHNNVVVTGSKGFTNIGRPVCYAK